MKMRTEVDVEPAGSLIDYDSPVVMTGSCFANEMAARLDEGLLPVLCNPFGVLYNPVSIANMLRRVARGREFGHDDLWFHNGRWLSFSHDTAFSSPDRQTILEKLNRSFRNAHRFIRTASFLFVTFGTARIYRRADSGEVVANCHKIPANFFTRELLTPGDIVSEWSEFIAELSEFNPALQIYFTVSPVRHWKDGAHGNQVSKSVLFVAIEELLKSDSVAGYFPSYEIVTDDLRDYRFYAADMLHPSSTAVEYIWEKFSGAFMSPESRSLYERIASITRATRHRLLNPQPDEVRLFSEKMLNRISQLSDELPSVDFSSLRRHFDDLLHSG